MTKHRYSEVVALIAALSALKIRTSKTGKKYAFFDVPAMDPLLAPGIKLLTAALEPFGMVPNENAFALGPSYLVEIATKHLFESVGVDGSVRLHTPISFDPVRFHVDIKRTGDDTGAIALARDLAALDHGPVQLWYSYPSAEEDNTSPVTLEFYTFRRADLPAMRAAVNVLRRVRSRIHVHCTISKEDHHG